MSSPVTTPVSTVKRALAEIRSLKSRLDDLNRRQHEPIAIVGIGLRFPGGCNDAASYWDLLSNGRHAISEIPSSRWNLADYYDPNPDHPGKMHTRFGGFLDGVEEFDADLFGISPREASTMDPQQRLLMEVSWEALENAGYNPHLLAGTSGAVFFGLSNSDYSRLVLADSDKIDAYSTTGSLLCVAAGRLSHTLGMEGPSMVIDTACSSSLVAVHLAARSLRAHECDLALAGGANLMLTPEIHINFSKLRMLSPDGLCKTFDASANGYVRSEGCGVVVLKRLSDAIAAKDHIWAVVRGSAVNQDGRSGGLTVPNGRAQEIVVKRALADAELAPDTISYVEAHGTGTVLGDPIEMHALASVFGEIKHRAFVGSAKTNLGHTEAAAGVAGLLKAVLSLHHRQIPPNLHFQKLNPHIFLDGAPLEIPASLQAWEHGPEPRRAGVSSFGFSGTNAHVIVEEAPQPEPAPLQSEKPVRILCLSARNGELLDELQHRYATFLRSEQPRADDLCFTANTGRAQAPHRRAWIGSDAASLLAALESGEPVASARARTEVRVAFLFPGQGPQYAGMGRELYETQPVFREALEQCRTVLRGLLDRDLTDLLWGEASTRLKRTSYTQPAMFSIEWSLAQLWISWGVQPAWVLGHSIGEYSAACVAGLWSVEEALALVAERGRLMEEQGGGAMTAVEATAAEVSTWIADMPDIALAAENGPTSVVVSGRLDAIERLEQKISGIGRRIVRLDVSEASHSPLMAPVEEQLRKRAAKVRFERLHKGFISSVTGSIAAQNELTGGDYWAGQVRNAVQFRRAVETLAAQGCTAYVEVGPGTTLLGLAKPIVNDEETAWVPSVRKSTADCVQIFDSAAKLWAHGVTVKWDELDRPYTRRRIPLPLTPFSRNRYWIDMPKARHTVQPDAWDDVCTAGHRQSQYAPLNMRLSEYAAKWASLDELTRAAVLCALHKLGLFRNAGETLSIEETLEKGHIVPGYSRLVTRWLSTLTELGLFESEGQNRFRSRIDLGQASLQSQLENASVLLADEPGILEYISACTQRLDDILTGRLSPLELLFPDGRFDRAEKLYQQSPMAQYLHGIAASVMKEVSRNAPGRHFTILEVGGGTGALTASLLPVLKASNTTYFFTDISRLFLSKTSEKFAAFDFVRYELLDLEQDFGEQGFEAASMDLVVASNVLHATADLRRTLDRLRRLLRPGGRLLMQEATRYPSWFDVTVALVEAWDSFDDGLRSNHPLLSASQWASLLRESGFIQCESFPRSGMEAEVLGQHIIIAGISADGTASCATNATPHAGRKSSQSDTRVAPIANLSIQLGNAAPVERMEMLVDLVRSEVCRILQLPREKTPNRDDRLMDLGVDSLMALELRSRIEKVLMLDQPLSSTLIFDCPTIAALARHLDNLLFPHTTEILRGATETGERLAQMLDTMSDADAEAVLLRKLQGL